MCMTEDPDLTGKVAELMMEMEMMRWPYLGR
jgi:hypothetical protein